MSETARNSNSPDSQMPAQEDGVKFPPFPEPRDVDFDEDVSEDEKNFYKSRFRDLHLVTSQRLHCTSCDRHLGCSASNDGRMRMHPMLRTLVCNTCYAFYNSGEFEKGDDGSELYCRWCGQGGQVYCCSDCPHVFCAKCIKRNLGTSKIKEIENTDDWKCFKCSYRCLWDLRATCWALLRYCDLKNRITLATQDPALKEKYLADCAKDYSDCCKNKKRRTKEIKVENKKKEEKKEADASAKKAAAVISKIPPTIQVKKFASINLDDSKPDNSKKGAKRSISPKHKSVFLKNPIAVAANKTYPAFPSMPKKIRLSSPNMGSPIRFVADRKGMNIMNTPPIRIRPKAQQQLTMPVLSSFNGYNSAPTYSSFINDNINLSLESLTQGLDMAAVAGMNNNNSNLQHDVVCTPDFPMEPLCEVTEDNGDDDVQCITPINAQKMSQPPPLVPRAANTLPDLSADNIIQMTENDVTVNAQTGGLKFRVDPQTLSSNKMYRLPDGRIFAINANPNMPGGYSATIVAVTETAAKNPAKGATYAAKLSAVPTQTPSPIARPARIPRTSSAKRVPNAKTNTNTRVTRGTETVSRECDLEVPVEWYRYNLIDAVDALEYSLSRLNKLKKDATTAHLRTRTISEMRGLHRSLERLLHTSTSRFDEIRDNLNKGLKQYLAKKAGNNLPSNNISDDDDDDDDVEILPDENDDPIFIDENSVDSNANDTNSVDQQEVDLTGALSNSELNESADKSIEMLDENLLRADENLNDESDEKNDTQTGDVDPLESTEPEKTDDGNKSSEKDGTSSKPTQGNDTLGNTEMDESLKNDNEDKNEQTDDASTKLDSVPESNNKIVESEPHKEKEDSEKDTNCTNNESENKSVNGDGEPKVVDSELKEKEVASPKNIPEDNNQDNVENRDEINDNQDIHDKVQDAEMSEEMIETLLKGDDGENDDDSQTMSNTEIIGI